MLAQIAADANEILGCNTRAHLADADRIFRARKAAELMDAGVTIYLPETVVIDPEVTAGPDTVIEPGVQLLARRASARAADSARAASCTTCAWTTTPSFGRTRIVDCEPHRRESAGGAVLAAASRRGYSRRARTSAISSK